MYPLLSVLFFILAAAADEPPKWNVQEPFGPTTALDFETDEGTWVNLDVSPDGKRIVFDLLGDLYLMPVEGTEGRLATRLTSGAAFDMQPRFSPDGARIAFASDRDGSTNLWVMKADGTDLRQVSKEKRWFVNSPAWSPDGNYLFARHHFVKERSLGAGEIWMYHDPSNNTEMVFTNAEMIRAGKKLGPRLYSTGTILYGAETPFKTAIETYEDALAHLKRLKAVGAFSVKSYNQQRRDVRQMIVKAARELEMMVVPEGGSLLYMDETFVLDGHTGLEHSLPVPNLYRDVVELFARSGTGYTPTLIVGYGGLSGEYYWYQHTNVWENEHLLQFTPREIVDERSRRRTMAEEDDFNHVLISRGAKKIVDAGGRVQLGAHGQLQGLGAHWELWMLHQGGMTPLEALRAATLDGARYLGLDAELGSLEAGKLADLVILSANPLEDIRHTERVSRVMLNGRLYEAATMEEVGRPSKNRRPFYWQ